MSERWHKAAILGSVWASIEIVLGSFLHNIRFPLTGTILSAVGITLLIAGHSLWKEKGIVWRAGVICAVMKSVSPSSVILGPMVGITVEAFIVEGAIRLFAGNTAGYILGGAIACTTPLIQKTISYLFVYGTNMVTVFEKLVEFASRNLNVPSLDSTDVVISVVGINLVFGGIASSLGIIVGKRARVHTEQPTLQIGQGRPENLKQSNFQFSIVLLVLHFAVLTSGLILQSIFFILYVPICIYRYPPIQKRFRKVSFWIEIAVVSLAAGLILGEFTLSDRMAGFYIGMQMFLRALFVVSVFSAINVEIRNPAVVRFLFRKHLKVFSTALDTAFGALPNIIDSLQQERMFFRHPIESLSHVLAHAGQMVRQQTGPSKIFIVTGDKDSGKSTTLERIVTRLTNEGIAVGGIIQRKVMKSSVRHGYDLYDILSQQSVPLCRTDAPDKGITAGPFKFYPEGIRFGLDALSISKFNGCDIVIIDEVGPLELTGKGWSGPLSENLNKFSGILLIVIRESLVDDIRNKFQFTPEEVWNLNYIEIDTILKHIRTSLKSQ